MLVGGLGSVEGTYLDSHIEVNIDVLGGYGDGLGTVDGHNLVLCDVVFRACRHLQNVIVCHICNALECVARIYSCSWVGLVILLRRG